MSRTAAGGGFAHESTPLADSPIMKNAAKNAFPDEVSAGMQIGEYQVTGKLGEGGMGTVYAGVHPVIGKQVAIKVLNRGARRRTPAMVQRFVQEARAVNQIGHRNIVDIFAFGQLPTGRHYFVMEFLQRAQPDGSGSTRGAAALRRGVRHPASTCATRSRPRTPRASSTATSSPTTSSSSSPRRGERTVKLLDFGIAKLLRARAHGAGADPHRRRRIGTPLYMSPEQCRGKRGRRAHRHLRARRDHVRDVHRARCRSPGPSYIETVNGHLSHAAAAADRARRHAGRARGADPALPGEGSRPRAAAPSLELRSHLFAGGRVDGREPRRSPLRRAYPP